MNNKTSSIVLLFIFGFNQFIFCPGKKDPDQPKRSVGSNSNDSLKKPVDKKTQEIVIAPKTDEKNQKAEKNRKLAAGRVIQAVQALRTIETEKILALKRIKEIDNQKKIMTESFLGDPELNKFRSIILDYYNSANPVFKQKTFASFFDKTPEGIAAQEKINQAKTADEILKATEERMQTRMAMQIQLDEFLETLKAQPEPGEDVEKYITGVLSEIANRSRPITPLTDSVQKVKKEQDFFVASQRNNTNEVFAKVERLNTQSKLEKTISTGKGKLSNALNELLAKNADLEVETKSLSVKNEELKIKKVSLKKQLSELDNEISNKESEKYFLETNDKIDQDAIKKVNKELFDLAGKQNSLNLQLEKTNSNLVKNKNSVRAKNQELKKLKTSINDTKLKIEEKNTQKKELDKRQNPRGDLEAKVGGL